MRSKYKTIKTLIFAFIILSILGVNIIRVAALDDEYKADPYPIEDGIFLRR
jgi:hypothetical protein